MAVRAKFRVNKIELTSIMSTVGRDANGADVYEKRELRTIVMSPVYGNKDPEHENTKFWNATPTGELRLGSVNAEAAKLFELDKEYYIDFTPAE